MSEATFSEELPAMLPKLRRYARTLTRDVTRADDLVQSCLTRALAKQHLWQPGTDLRAWLFTILHNQHVNDVRSARRDAGEIASTNAEAVELLPARDDPTVGLLIRDLRRAMMRLDPDQRRTILLVGYHGLGYERAAEIENVPVGTIRSRLSRGRAELRLLLDGHSISAEERDLIERWARA